MQLKSKNARWLAAAPFLIAGCSMVLPAENTSHWEQLHADILADLETHKFPAQLDVLKTTIKHLPEAMAETELRAKLRLMEFETYPVERETAFKPICPDADTAFVSIRRLQPNSPYEVRILSCIKNGESQQASANVFLRSL